MKTIKITGPIVDASFDNDFWMESIARGAITPSSYILRKLYQAEKANESVKIEISSPGGNAIAAGDIAIALKKYPHDLTIELGAFVASAACNLALLSGRKMVCHENTIMLLHSAWADDLAGGPGALRDEADLLDKINQPVIDILKSHGVPEAKIKEGFSEGRILTLDAKELQEYGFVKNDDVDGVMPVDTDDKDSEDENKGHDMVEELKVIFSSEDKADAEVSIKAEADTKVADMPVESADESNGDTKVEAKVDDTNVEAKEDTDVEAKEEDAKVESRVDDDQSETKVDDVKVESNAGEAKVEAKVEAPIKAIDENKIVAVMSESKDMHSEYMATKQGKDRLAWLLKHPTYRK